MQSVEFTATARGDNFVFFTSNGYTKYQSLIDMIHTAAPDVTVLSKTSLDGKNVIVARTSKAPEQIIKEMSAFGGESYRPQGEAKEKKGTDLIRLRGNIGIVAQILMIASAFFDSDKKGEAEKEGAKNYYKTPAGQGKIRTSAISFVGYTINSIFGVQKDTDSTRLSYAKNLVNQQLKLRQDDNSRPLPAPEDTIRKIDGAHRPSWMQRNSIRFSSGMKLVSKVPLLQLGSKKKDNEKLKATASGNGDDRDESLALSGALGIVSDVISLTGLPEDPYLLEKKQDALSVMRRKSNLISSFFDWASTLSLSFGSLNKPLDKTNPEAKKPRRSRKTNEMDGGELKDPTPKGAMARIIHTLGENHERRDLHEIQWFQLAASLGFAINLIIKALAPYTVRKLDTENLIDHTSLALASGMKSDYTDELTQVTSNMLLTRELPEVKQLGFAKTFTQIANRMEKHHNIALKPVNYNSRAAVAASAVVEAQTPAEAPPSPAQRIAATQPAASMTEKVLSPVNTPTEGITSGL